MRPSAADLDTSADLAAIREGLRREAESITKRKRLQQTMKALIKHGVMHLIQDRSKDEITKQRLLGQRLKRVFEELGPTFIKLGQVILTRQELLPPALTAELEGLLSDVPAMSYLKMLSVLDADMPNWRERVEWMSPEPLGSASLAQVYQARLKDGRMAAVKIVRPLVDQLFRVDIAVIKKWVRRVERWLPPEKAASLDLSGLIADYYSSAMDELDMRREADQMNEHRKWAHEYGTLHVPEVYYVSERVLMMEYIDGWNLKDFPVDFLSFEERLERMTDLAHYYIKSFSEGYYHADPHGSNIRIDRNTKKAVVLDWGMVGRMDAIHTEAIFRMLLHIRVNQAEDAAEVALDIYEPTTYTDPVNLRDQLRALFIHYTNSHQGSRYNWGNLLFSTILIAIKNACRVPTGLALWAKGFSAAEGTARWLCPEVSYHDLVETADVQILRRWLSRRFNFRTNATFLTESAKVLATLPRRINKILENVSWNKVQLTVDTQLSRSSTQTLQHLVNRVTLAFLAGTAFLGGTVLLAFGEQNGAFHSAGVIALGRTAVGVSVVLGICSLWGLVRSIGKRR